MAAPIYIFTNSVQGSLFFTSLQILVICCLLYNSHSDSCEVIPHCGLIHTFLMISDVEHLFMYVLVICMSVFGKTSIQILCSFLNQIVYLLLSCMSSLYILDINPLSYMCFSNISFFLVGCLFILLMVFFAVQKLFG